MTNQPVPASNNPNAAGMRASDSDRIVVTDLLGTAYVDGRLDRDEYQDRLSRAMAARTHGELQVLTADLVPVADSGGRPVPADGPLGVASPRSTRSVGTEFSVAIFSGSELVVPELPPTLVSVALFGGNQIDLREASFVNNQVSINALTMFGGTQIVVRPGTQVRIRVLPLFGGVGQHNKSMPDDPGAPIVTITGVVAFGGMGVRYAEPGEEV